MIKQQECIVYTLDSWCLSSILSSHFWLSFALQQKSESERKSIVYDFQSTNFEYGIYKVLRDNTFIGRSRVVHRATKL